MFYCLFQSIDTLTYAVQTFVDNCISGITANRERCQELVDRSIGIVTALCPYIGYERAADLAKRALHENTSIRKLILDEKIMTQEELDRVLNPVKMTNPGIQGKN